MISAIDVEGNAVLFDGVKSGSVNYTFSVNSQTGAVTVTPPTGYVGTMDVLLRVKAAGATDTADTYDTQLVSIDRGVRRTHGCGPGGRQRLRLSQHGQPDEPHRPDVRGHGCHERGTGSVVPRQHSAGAGDRQWHQCHHHDFESGRPGRWGVHRVCHPGRQQCREQRFAVAERDARQDGSTRLHLHASHDGDDRDAVDLRRAEPGGRHYRRGILVDQRAGGRVDQRRQRTVDVDAHGLTVGSCRRSRS